jgi:type IV secretory pathway VirB10-like protein
MNLKHQDTLFKDVNFGAFEDYILGTSEDRAKKAPSNIKAEKVATVAGSEDGEDNNNPEPDKKPAPAPAPALAPPAPAPAKKDAPAKIKSEIDSVFEDLGIV